MITLNPFVENNKARINQFLNYLCEVGDFYDTLEVGQSVFFLAYSTQCLLQMDQYMALSKKDLMINITLNELYNTHSLILQHIETLVRNPYMCLHEHC
jgi:Ras GTPase-activating-like protein IQGAP2/3